MTTHSLQDKLNDVETAHKIILHSLFYIESMLKVWRDSPNSPVTPTELAQLEGRADELHNSLARLKATASMLKDRIEAEAEPEEDQAPISAVQDFTPDTTEITEGELNQLLRHVVLRYPEPAFTGGQILNRILDNHAENIGVYYVEDDGDGGEKLTPVTIFEIDDDKVILG